MERREFLKGVIGGLTALGLRVTLPRGADAAVIQEETAQPDQKDRSAWFDDFSQLDGDIHSCMLPPWGTFGINSHTSPRSIEGLTLLIGPFYATYSDDHGPWMIDGKTYVK